MLRALFFKLLETWFPHQKDIRFCYGLIHINTYTNICEKNKWKRGSWNGYLSYMAGILIFSILISLSWSILFFKNSGYDLSNDFTVHQWVMILTLRNRVATAACLWLRCVLVYRWRQPHSQRPYRETTVCGRETCMVGGISIKLRKRIPCSFKELKEVCNAAQFWLFQELNNVAWLTAHELGDWNGRWLTLWSQHLWSQGFGSLCYGATSGECFQQPHRCSCSLCIPDWLCKQRV